jgi:hypothetical protein
MVTALQSSAERSGTGLDDAGPLLAAVMEANRQTAQLIVPERFAGTIDALVVRAHALGASVLHGASGIGQSLAGAMAYASGQLRLWQVGEGTSVLLVEGVVASLAGVLFVGERLKAMGAESVDALVLGSLSHGGHRRDQASSIGQVVTLEELRPAAA